MTKDEEVFLRDLYAKTSSLNEERMYSADDIICLLKKEKSKSGDYLKDMVDYRREAEKVLVSLYSRQWITYRREGEGFYVTISQGGFLIAQSLDSFWGRVEVWYEENKDSFIWLLVTAAVSCIVSIVVSILLK